MRIIVLSLLLLILTGGCQLADQSQQHAENNPQTVAPAGGYLRNDHNQRVIVFVHGVLGDARDTWTADNGAFWPTLLLDDPSFNEFDVYVHDYPTPLFAISLSIDELADNLRLRLNNSAVFENHQEVIFVCHSMGGLVTRQLLLKYRYFAPKVSMIYFLSTPSTGSDIAALASIVAGRNPQYDDMKPWKDNAYVGNLVRQWHAAQFRIKSYCAYEKLSTYGEKVVDEQSPTNLCNQPLDPILADHMGIAKPRNRSDDSYIAFRQAVAHTPLTPTASPPAQSNAVPERSKLVERLDLEISYRYSQILGQLYNLTDRHQPNPHLARERNVEDVKKVIGLLKQSPSENFVALYPEFSNLGIPSLVADLRGQVSTEKERQELDRVLGDVVGFEPGNVNLSNVQQVGGIVLDKLMISRWKNSSFYFTDCSARHPFC